MRSPRSVSPALSFSLALGVSVAGFAKKSGCLYTIIQPPIARSQNPLTRIVPSTTAYFRGSLGITLIAINFLFSGIGSQPLLQLTFQSYIVDCVKTEERSPTFALLGSATFGGLAVSSVVSSLMTTYTE